MEDDILEKLADIEHRQWCEWSASISKEILSLVSMLDKFEDDLSDDEKSAISKIKDKMARWDNLNVDYSELPEHEKEKDRVYARKILPLLEN